MKRADEKGQNFEGSIFRTATPASCVRVLEGCLRLSRSISVLDVEGLEVSPGLYLVSKEKLDFEVLLLDKGKDRGIDYRKHFGAVGTNIVKEKLDSVESFRRRAHGEPLPGEFWCESHY